MLVLSRKEGETIHIGDDVRVVVVEIDRGKIRLGVAAPRDVQIWRGEIYGTMHPPTNEQLSPVPELDKEYVHYKGGRYRVLTLAKDQNEHVVVVYRRVDTSEVWVCSVWEWRKMVDGQERFTKVEDVN